MAHNPEKEIKTQPVDMVSEEEVYRAVPRMPENYKNNPIDRCIDLGDTFLNPEVKVDTNNSTTREILNEREKTNGSFNTVAIVSNTLYDIIIIKRNNANLPAYSLIQKEALKMICVKLARIIVGNPNYEDHWKDIA